MGHNWQNFLRGGWTQLHKTSPGHMAIIAALHFCFRRRISCCIFIWAMLNWRDSPAACPNLSGNKILNIFCHVAGSKPLLPDRTTCCMKALLLRTSTSPAEANHVTITLVELLLLTVFASACWYTLGLGLHEGIRTVHLVCLLQVCNSRIAYNSSLSCS